MSSWFSGLKDLSKDLSEKVQAALPKIDSETLQKLTLNTPELQAERAALQQEYHHKVAVKDSLAHMYPWETRDAERDILVEECKDAIMALSLSVDTFFGPYPMPLLNVNTDDDDDKDKDDEDEDEQKDEDGNPNTQDDGNATGTTGKKPVKDMEPSMESLEKLAKLEPLPPLLADFDLIAHVGLIQKMLKVDRNLVERQSTLSGGGEREKVFWRNYFFHCAFTRYEAGLSIDEIWSDAPPPPPHSEAVLPGEEVVEFHSTAATDETSGGATARSATNSSTNSATNLLGPEDTGASALGDYVFEDHDKPSSTDSPTPDYEIIESSMGNDDMNGDDDEDAFAGEMDELEAEIAQALGD